MHTGEYDWTQLVKNDNDGLEVIATRDSEW